MFYYTAILMGCIAGFAHCMAVCPSICLSHICFLLNKKPSCR